MLLTPAAHESLRGCYCNVVNESLDSRTCYLWIHLPFERGSAIQFSSILEAYAFGEKFVFMNNARALCDCDDDSETSIRWNTSNGVFCSPDMTWCIKICSIYSDIANSRVPDRWVFLVTPRHQMILSLTKNYPGPELVDVITI